MALGMRIDAVGTIKWQLGELCLLMRFKSSANAARPLADGLPDANRDFWNIHRKRREAERDDRVRA